MSRVQKILLLVSCGVTGEKSPIITTGDSVPDILHRIVKPDPPMKRALQVAKSKLEAAGIKVVDWEPYKSEEALEIIVQSRLYPFDDHANHRQSTMFFPDAARTQLDLTEAAGEPLNADAAAALRRARLLSIREVWVYNDRRDRLRAEHHALMKSRGVDVIICPPYPGCAPLRNTVDWGSYTMLWNLFDLPALVFPTGLSVDAALDPVQVGYEPLNEFDKRQHEKCKLLQAQGQFSNADTSGR